MKRGARDYLIKDNEGGYLELLPAVIERVLTEQRLLEERNNAEAQYRTLVERIPAITYVANLEHRGETIFISPQISCLGFTPEEWIAQHDRWMQQIHPEDRDRALQAVLNSRNTGEPLSCDYRIHTRTGEIRWFHDEASVLHDARDKTEVLQGIMLDITEKKMMEDELAKHRYQLESRWSSTRPRWSGASRRWRPATPACARCWRSARMRCASRGWPASATSSC
jgi:PAS domain S-box-containing protein